MVILIPKLKHPAPRGGVLTALPKLLAFAGRRPKGRRIYSGRIKNYASELFSANAHARSRERGREGWGGGVYWLVWHNFINGTLENSTPLTINQLEHIRPTSLLSTFHSRITGRSFSRPIRIRVTKAGYRLSSSDRVRWSSRL